MLFNATYEVITCCNISNVLSRDVFDKIFGMTCALCCHDEMCLMRYVLQHSMFDMLLCMICLTQYML